MQRPGPAAAAAVLAALIIVVFGRTVGFEFLQWDDDINVTENPMLATGSTGELPRVWSAPYAGLYVPVTYTWFWAERSLSRLGERATPDPRIFHAGNVLLHFGCAWLVFLLLRRWTAAAWPALAGAALFALHPVQVEVVAWVTASKDLLSAFFSLAALLLWVRFRETEGRRFWTLATVAYALALLAKPSAVVVPLLAALLDLGLLKQGFRQMVKPLAPWLALAAVLVLFTKSQQPEFVMRETVALTARPGVALDALAFYLAKLLAPTGLIPDYGRTPSQVAATGQILWSWIVPVAVGAALLLTRRARPWRAAAAWLPVTLLPVLGLVTFEFQNISTVADRYLYLGLVGPALATAMALARFPKTPAFAVAALVVAVLGAASFRQTSFWKDTETLFGRTLALNPASYTAHNNLGNELLDRGRYQEAVAHFDHVVRTVPRFFPAWVNRGNANRQLGLLEEAAADYGAAVRLVPTHVDARLHLAQTLEALGRSEEAARHYEAANRGPAETAEKAESRNTLGVRFYERGDMEQAEIHFRAALASRPAYAEAHNNLANALVRLGRYDEALTHYREALQINPDYYSAHRNVGLLLMQSVDTHSAIRHLERALELGGPDPDVERRLETLRARIAGQSR